MLDTIRNATNSWIAKFFLGILLLSFVLLWGVPELQRSNGNALLTSGKSTINMEDYNYAYGDNSMRISSAYGRILSETELKQNNIPALVINKLQQDILLDEQARLMKIGVSKDGIAKAIGDDRFFYQDDAFNRNLFIGYLQQLNARESDAVRYYAAQQKRLQLLLGATAGIKAPDVFYAAYQTYQQETRSADYITITPEMVGTIAEPDQATLEKWFSQNQSLFQAPEYRKVTLVQMTPSDLSKPQDILEEEVKNYYEQNISTYSTPEKRRIELLRFTTRADADAAAQKLKDGSSFEDIVTAEHKTLAEINSGFLPRAEFPSTFANDIFALKQTEISNVINDIQGPVIIRLIDIQPTVAKPFDSVKKEIRQTLADRNAAQSLRNNYDDIENARFEGLSIKDIATRYNLPVREVTIDAQGTTPEGEALTNLPQQVALLNNVFQASVDADLDPISLSQAGYAWYHVDEIIPSRPKTLDEVKEAAITTWKAQELQRLLDEKANDILKQLQDSATLDTVTAALNQPKKTAHSLQRGKADSIFGIEGVNAVFAGAKGYMAAITGAEKNNRIVFVVTEIVEPLNTSATKLTKEDKDTIDGMLVQDLATQMIEYARQQHPVELNTNNYNRIINNYQ